MTNQTMPTQSFSLADKTVMVTGASSGLGAHFAKVASRAGARVVLGARRVERLAKLAEDIQWAEPTADLALEDGLVRYRNVMTDAEGAIEGVSLLTYATQRAPNNALAR